MDKSSYPRMRSRCSSHCGSGTEENFAAEFKDEAALQTFVKQSREEWRPKWMDASSLVPVHMFDGDPYSEVSLSTKAKEETPHVLGAGSFGNVYRLKDVKTQRHEDSNIQRFKNSKTQRFHDLKTRRFEDLKTGRLKT